MFSNPVNTALCKDEIGSICCPGENSEGSGVYFEDTDTNEITGTGAQLTPYRVNLRVDPAEDNILTYSEEGVKVPAPTVIGADNGVSLLTKKVQLGGPLLKDTIITGNGFDLTFEGADIGSGDKFAARTKPTVTGTYQEIVLDPSNWAQLVNIIGASANVIQVMSNNVLIKSTVSADGVTLSVTPTGITIVHNTPTLPITINQIFLDGRMSGTDAVNGNEFVTKQQVYTVVSPVINTLRETTYFTNANMNTDYPLATYPVGIRIVFTNLSDAPSNTAELRRISNTEWAVSYAANKLS